jgi:glycosyltransferase involved in cell wall biosynthesis
MNIALITTWFPAGGGYVSKAYQHILKKEHNVFIYVRGGQVMKGHPDWDYPNVTWAPRHYNGIKTNHFVSWLKKNKIDVAFFNEQRYWKPVLEAKKAGFCVGAYIDYYTQETVPAFEIYDFLICNTKRHYSVFDWHPNAQYVPWGTDIEKFKPAIENIERIPTFIISAGWQAKYTGDRRGSLIAIKAFKKVKGDCKLNVYSQVAFDECLPEWKELLASDSRIEFKVGTFDPFPYREGDVYLYPSRLDGIGLTLPEAVSSGLAVITTNNAPMNEFAVDGYNGLLIDVEKFIARPDGYYWPESICNLDSLTEAMQKLINNPSILNKYKVNARESAEKNLNWSKNASNLSEIFEYAYNSKSAKLKPSLIDILNKLDKKMAPTDVYKIASAVATTLRHQFKN